MNQAINIGRNIKKLRENLQVTQEQLASEMKVSFQAVSKWENGVNVPDVSLLPKIARYFRVTIDDLFKDEVEIYPNYAARLLAIYENSHNQDDFIRADSEYKKMLLENKYTIDDLRGYGLLYEYHLSFCMNEALGFYERALKESAKKDELYYRVRRQKTLLLSKVGRAQEGITEEEGHYKENPECIDNCISLLSAYYWGKEYKTGYQFFKSIIDKYATENALLYCIGGDICRCLKEYEEAFEYWNRSIQIDDKFADARFSIAFCYNEIMQYDKEAEAWENIVQWLSERGYTEIELSWPRKMLTEAIKRV